MDIWLSSAGFGQPPNVLTVPILFLETMGIEGFKRVGIGRGRCGSLWVEEKRKEEARSQHKNTPKCYEVKL